MSRSVVFRPEARTELALAWAWYEEKRVGLGDELVVCVEAAIAGASRDPDLHRRIRGEVRRALVRRFPYGVFFVTDDDELLVLAIAHDRRSPGYWESRLSDE